MMSQGQALVLALLLLVASRPMPGWTAAMRVRDLIAKACCRVLADDSESSAVEWTAFMCQIQAERIEERTAAESFVRVRLSSEQLPGSDKVSVCDFGAARCELISLGWQGGRHHCPRRSQILQPGILVGRLI